MHSGLARDLRRWARHLVLHLRVSAPAVWPQTFPPRTVQISLPGSPRLPRSWRGLRVLLQLPRQPA
eukprot:7174496-Pyramimonas_sp.AAC.1